MAISKTNGEGYDDPTAYSALTKIEKEVRRKHGYRPLVFICSPLAGAFKQNQARARRYSKFAVRKGAIPFAPHLLFPQILDDRDPAQRNLGIFFGLVIMAKCDEVWVFGKYMSNGMRMEIVKARARGIRIRFFTDKCKEVNRHGS